MSTSPGTTTSASRAADVLLLFSDESDRLGISEIARRLDLSKAVVHRIVVSFVEKRLLMAERDRTYRLGPAMAALGARALRGSTLRAVAVPYLDGLRDATGETATLSSLINDRRVYLAQAEGLSEIKMTVEIGRRYPLHVGSSGRCILAFQPDDVITELLDDVGVTGPDAEAVRQQLAQARASGWTASLGERQQGAGSVAAPVFNLDGRAIGAVSVCGPIHRMTPEANARHATAVSQVAQKVSRGLGWHGGLPDPATVVITRPVA
ncbi:IclR family transcriptional regulator [Nocardioides dubius]|uniref:IclR family transcriptional regulator n=1 Tax=Nocardioides dubius TaxID=317019 RepID=A0ABN1TMG6_9ACTN